ncbi:GAF domain-containing protein [Leptolyngbya sp. FACHB-17]|uniref:GAF domain-containing protein n=1 Tax=unclassified Leptolyngbya TaxID=2650499 RepID=UPI0016803DCF|nr:GAF domain-containing protein [Leptolyngbya sp. FACHB-17]MBD2080112.1 GAF domain-containing protein [Leptolyngbya sp. FACHB-17]
MGYSKETTQSEQHLIALSRVLKHLREGDTLAIESVYAYLNTCFAFDLVWIGLYDRAEHRLSGKGGKSPLRDAPFLKQRFILTPGDILEQAVIQQIPLTFPDLREEQRANEWRKFAEKANIQGAMIFPISLKNQCYGVTIVGSKLWGSFPRPEEQSLIAIVLGEFAATLEAAEQEQKRQQIKHVDRPMLTMLSELRSLPNFEQRLDRVIEQVQQFVQPARTSLYWFEPTRRYFWRRATNQKGTRSIDSASGLTVQEMSSFYQALQADQVITIGESISLTKAEITVRVMEFIRARSLIAAPILCQNELLGFLTAESDQPRSWQDEDKRFMRAAAQLLGVVSPLEGMENTIAQVKLDQALTAEIAKAIYSTGDGVSAFQNAATLLNQRLGIDRVVVLLYDSDRDAFEVRYQTQPQYKRPLPAWFGSLSPIDWQMLEKQSSPIAIENLADDLRFAAWRTPLLELGVRSLLVCSTTLGHAVEGVLILAHEQARSWTQREGEFTKIAAQQVGIVLRQWSLQQQNDQQRKIYQTIQWGLNTIQQTQHLDLLEKSALQYIAQILEAPLAVLVGWAAGRGIGRVVQSNNDRRFHIDPILKVSIETDTFLQRVLAHDGILSVSIDEIPIETRQWLNAPGIGQILAITLRTAPEHEPTAVVLVADRLERQWLDRHLTVLNTLVAQFAWSRRHLMVSEALKRDRERLERLSWYKHRRLEDLYRSVKFSVSRLAELPLGDARQAQLLRQIDTTIDPVRHVIRDEQWQLTIRNETVQMIGLVRRALDRVDHLLKQRQLWSQVHHEINPMIYGDITKLELVLYELLLIACQRANLGGRIDIWCRQISAQWMEIAITDDGVIEPRLCEDLEAGRAVDLLAPSTLDKPPGLHLAICRSLMQQMGSEFNLYKLDDGRIMSRVVLPIA